MLSLQLAPTFKIGTRIFYKDFKSNLLDRVHDTMFLVSAASLTDNIKLVSLLLDVVLASTEPVWLPYPCHSSLNADSPQRFFNAKIA